MDMKIKLKEARQDGVRDGTFRIVVDGYNAPVTAGDFVDLVERKFYDGMEIQRADGFVVQTGKPDGAVRTPVTLPILVLQSFFFFPPLFFLEGEMGRLYCACLCVLIP